MNSITLLVAGLAAWQAVAVFRHAYITLPLRRKLAAVVEHSDGAAYFFAHLLNCPFCLSHWVAGALVAGLWLDWAPFNWLCWTLAAARLANLGNDVFYDSDRTPKYDHNEELQDDQHTIDLPTPDLL